MKSENTIIVTGGAGFIGSNFILDWIKLDRGRVVNLDKLTYSGNLSNLASLKDDPHHIFVHGDIGDQSLVDNLLEKYRPYAVVHFAAESHVDRSIIAPEAFVQTNVVGTYRLLESVLVHWNKLDKDKDKFKFFTCLHR